MALFLAGLIPSGIAATLLCGVGTLLNDMTFDPDCHMQGPQNDTLFVRYTLNFHINPIRTHRIPLFLIFATHVILRRLSAQKRNTTAHNGRMRQKFVHVVARDGAWIFFPNGVLYATLSGIASAFPSSN